MKDGEIKKTGNSRFMRSLNMPDTYDEFKALLESGIFPFDLNGINPDGWKTIPDWLNKANLLSDGVCTGFGLPTTSVPNDVNKQFTKYWWIKRKYSISPKINFGNFCMLYISNEEKASRTQKIYYGDEIYKTGSTVKIRNSDYIYVSYNNYTEANKLKGKYFKKDDGDSIHFISSNASDATQYKDPYFHHPSVVMYGKSVDSIITNVNIGNWTYLSSTYPSAYPTGVSNGYQYIKLDTPWENARNCVRIQSGGYIGTGGVTTIHFSHTPQVLFISLLQSTEVANLIVLYGQTKADLDGYNYEVTWSNDKVEINGLNTTGEGYFYVFLY